MRHYEQVHGTRQTPQSEAIPGREAAMAKNNAGGFSFVIDDWARLQRFLVLGTERGTYYVGERELSKDNAAVVMRCAKADGARTVREIVDISVSGRAPKNDEALFALAMCAGSEDLAVRQAALAALPKVARTGTHLFQFLTYVKAFRGWGRSLRRAVAAWYDEKEPKKLELQLVKYRSREGWTHKDALSLALGRKALQDELVANALRRPGDDPVVLRRKRALEAMLWAYAQSEKPNKETEEGSWAPTATRDGNQLLWAFERAQEAKDNPKECARLAREYGLPWEALPTEVLSEHVVMEALLPTMGVTALVRQLARMTANGFIKPLSEASKVVCERLTNAEQISRSRIHPMAVLIAMRTYQQGRGLKGSLTWSPVAAVVDALDAAFYGSFGNVVPTGKKILLALDISGSMGAMSSQQGLTCREASVAMALITAKTEKEHLIVGFSAPSGGGHGGRWGGGSPGLMTLDISPRQRLTDAVQAVSNLPFGGTDCALPWIWAKREKIEVDAAVVFTDNETWHGAIHPTQALQAYRQATGRAAKAAVCALTPSKFSIADPNDAGQMDFVGLDAALPHLLSDFIRGDRGESVSAAEES